jgi:CheY-like chemotaxis protein
VLEKNERGEYMATILVVDDQDIMREFMVVVLESHRVLEAENGMKALEVLKAQPVDLVISDIQMPGMSGFDLHDKVPDKKFIFVSGYFSSDELKRVGNVPLLKKPFRSNEFLEEVKKILGG